MPGNAMEEELDDIMDQFLEMERELGSFVYEETDTVKLRKKPSASDTKVSVLWKDTIHCRSTNDLTRVFLSGS